MSIAARLFFSVGVMGAVACKFPDLPPLESDAQRDANADGATDAPSCTPNITTCDSGTLIECDAAGSATVTVCGFGCALAGDRCYDLSASNGLSGALDQALTAPPLVLTGNAVIDTTAETVRDGDGTLVTVQATTLATSPVEIFVVSASSLTAANVRVQGTRALALMVDGDLVLSGALSLSATHEVRGPGALPYFHGSCTAQPGTPVSGGAAGGGGGGFGTAGGRGGDGAGGVGGTGGVANGGAENVPLRGGCEGHHAFGSPPSDPRDKQAGGGGGAVQISARGRVRLLGGAVIAANGGGAKAWTGPLSFCNTNSTDCNQGCGGGAGGAILIEASQVEVATTTILAANGGAGHCGYTGLAGDGQPGDAPAPGTTCTGVSGSGGAGAAAGGGLVNATSGTTYGGGGGGGMGRIRINLPAGVAFDAGDAVLSPLPSFGTAAVR